MLSDDDIEIIELDGNVHKPIIKQEPDVLIISDDEQQSKSDANRKNTPKKELKSEDIVMDWSIFKKNVTKNETVTIDEDIQNEENPLFAIREAQHKKSECIKTKPNLLDVHPEIDNVKSSKDCKIESGTIKNVDEIVLDDDDEIQQETVNNRKNVRLFDIENEPSAEIEFDSMRHFAALRLTFKENYEHYELFLNKVMSTLCNIKSFVNKRAEAYQPSNVFDVFLNDTNIKSEKAFTVEMKLNKFDNPIIEKFVSKLKKLNVHEGNKIEEFIEKTKFMNKLKDNFSLMMNYLFKEEGLLKYIVSDIEESNTILTATQTEALKFIVSELKTFTNKLHCNMEDIFGDLINESDYSNDRFEEIHEDQFADIFNKTCELLEKKFGKITQIYHCSENDQYFFSFKDVPQLKKVNFRELIIQNEAKEEMDAFEKIFSLKKDGEFFDDKTNKRTIFLNRANHSDLQKSCDQIIVSIQNSDQLDIVYVSKKIYKNVSLDLIDFFKYFMQKIFSDLYHFKIFQCLLKSDQNPKKFLDKDLLVFDLDRFIDDETAWLSILVFCFSKNIFGSEYFEKVFLK